MQVQPPGRIAGDFVSDTTEMVPFRDRTAERARGCIDVESVGSADLVDAEEVCTVADDVDGAEMVLAGDDGEAGDRLLGIVTVGFGDDVRLWNAVLHEVIAADATFGVLVASLFAAKSDQKGCESFAIEGKGMPQTVAQDRGGATIVFCGTEDSNGVCAASLIVAGVITDFQVDVGNP